MVSLSLETLYEGWAAQVRRDPPLSLDETRAMFEHWGDVTPEPAAVDYIHDDAGGVPALWARPKQAGSRIVLCFHGGGFVVGSMYSHRKLFGHLAKALDAQALILNYALAPEAPHPAPLNDAVKAYEWLLSRGHEAQDILLAGDSAGGSLAVAAQLRIRDLGLAAPMGAVALSPYFDLEARCDSFDRNAQNDILVSRDIATGMAATFLGQDGDATDPSANPLYARLEGLGPVLIQASADETLVGGAEEFADKARAAGIDVTLERFAGQQHVFHFAASRSQVASDAIRRIGEWVDARTDRR